MKILVASDGSKHALRGLKAAVELVAELRSKSSTITLINVHDDTGLRHAKSLVGKQEVEDYLRDLSDKELKPSRELLDASGIKHTVEVCTGHVAQSIIDFASKEKFDLVVLGSKGRGGIADLLLGSVAQRVMAAAAQPVLLVK